MDYHKQIRQSFWQGMVKIIVLHQASVAAVYGSKLSKYFSKLGYEISPGSLYPLLHSLERARFLRGRVKVYQGRVRKYYETTAIGQSCLNELRQQVSGIVREIIFDSPPEITAPSQRITQ
jgi:PadR family transcriptional regulator PadR